MWSWNHKKFAAQTLILVCQSRLPDKSVKTYVQWYGFRLLAQCKGKIFLRLWSSLRMFRDNILSTVAQSRFRPLMHCQNLSATLFRIFRRNLKRIDQRHLPFLTVISAFAWTFVSWDRPQCGYGLCWLRSVVYFGQILPSLLFRLAQDPVAVRVADHKAILAMLPQKFAPGKLLKRNIALAWYYHSTGSANFETDLACTVMHDGKTSCSQDIRTSKGI